MVKRKYIWVVLAVFGMPLLASTGCSQKEKEAVVIEDMETEAVPSYSFDYIGGKDVMPIIGYYGPYLTMHSYDGNNFKPWFKR